LFAQASSIVSPHYLGMLAQLPLFHRRAQAALARPDDGRDRTLGEFLVAGRFSRYFVQHFAIPLVSAVWSCDPCMVVDYPVRYLFTFLQNHGMLSVSGSPTW